MPRDIDVMPAHSPGVLVLPGIPRLQYRGNLAAELAAGLSPARALELYETLLMVRLFEETVVAMKQGKFEPVPGFRYNGASHLCIGQEAVAVGALAALLLGDAITSTHRGHGHALAQVALMLRQMDAAGLDRFLGDAPAPAAGDPAALLPAALDHHLFRMFAELLGKQAGYCHGRGGSMHIADFAFGHLGANAIVAGSTALATGAAIGYAKQGRPHVVVCFIGDGAVANGVCLESFNLATMRQFRKGTPVVYVVENNQYAMSGQSIHEVTGLDCIARRGAGFDLRAMNAEVVDGMDLLAVRDALQRARATALAGRGPVLLECLTYRYVGHSLSDDGSRYRSDQEVVAWRALDPVVRFRQQLAAAGVVSEAAAADLAEQVRARVQAAAIRAAQAPDPDPAGIADGLFAATTSDRIGPELATGDYDAARVRQIPRNARGEILYRHAILEAMTEEMLRDRRVVFYGEDVADYGGAFQVTVGLLDIFGRERVFNAPISESAIAGAAVGMAMVGLRPIAEIMYIDFILQAMDQVGNQAAKTRYMFGGKATLPLVYRTTVGGGKGYAGQHSQSLEALLCHIPGLKVVMPSTPFDAKGLLKTAIRDDNPVVFIEHQNLYTERGPVPREEYTIPFGTAAVRREGRDVTLVAYSWMATVAMAAAAALAAVGISAEVIDPRTLVPLDVDTLVASARKTGRVVVLSQAPARGCFGEHIAYVVQQAAFRSLRAPVQIIAAHDVPPPMSHVLEQANLPGPERVATRVRELLGR